MPLVIEDGTLVDGANSYVTLVECRDYFSARGLASEADDTKLEQHLVRAKDYIESKREDFQGYKVSSSQALQFPREGLYIDGFEVTNTTIPQTLKDAQCQLASELINEVDIFPTSAGGYVIREKVGPLEVSYSDRVSTTVEPIITSVDALLRPLFSSKGSTFTTVRV